MVGRTPWSAADPLAGFLHLSEISCHPAWAGAVATRELGEFDMKASADAVAAALRAIKADQNSLKLQNEFFEKTRKPLETQQ